MQNKTVKIKTCPLCGAVFECFHSTECWCMAYVISKENMELIRTSFNDCLCESCLKKYVSGTKNAVC